MRHHHRAPEVPRPNAIWRHASDNGPATARENGGIACSSKLPGTTTPGMLATTSVPGVPDPFSHERVHTSPDNRTHLSRTPGAVYVTCLKARWPLHSGQKEKPGVSRPIEVGVRSLLLVTFAGAKWHTYVLSASIRYHPGLACQNVNSPPSVGIKKSVLSASVATDISVTT